MPNLHQLTFRMVNFYIDGQKLEEIICNDLIKLKIFQFEMSRTSTVILIRRNQSGLFTEKTLADPPGNPNKWSGQIFEFQLGNVNREPILKSFSS